MATVLERPVQGYTTLEDALGGIFGKLTQLERGQKMIQGGLEALAEAHGNFATKGPDDPRPGATW